MKFWLISNTIYGFDISCKLSLKTMKLLDCVLIGICAAIRSNVVFSLYFKLGANADRADLYQHANLGSLNRIFSVYGKCSKLLNTFIPYFLG